MSANFYYTHLKRNVKTFLPGAEPSLKMLIKQIDMGWQAHDLPMPGRGLWGRAV